MEQESSIVRTAVNGKSRRTTVIVGAGMSGLTAGAYLLRGGHNVVILEKSTECGGLVSSFVKDGFLFDTGPRAIGNAGILVPMLEDLKIDLCLLKGEVSKGIADRVVHFDSNADIADYIVALKNLFPDSLNEIEEIYSQIKTFTRMAGVLNRVANPFFKKIPGDWNYLFRDLLPWLPSFLSVVTKTLLFNKSMEEVLRSISTNRSLNDMVSQHFFKGTPANFAFGYFENYQDYKYPSGGTGQLPNSLVEKINDGGGVIRNNTEVVKIDAVDRILTDRNGAEYSYDTLLWTADLKTLYHLIDPCKFSFRLQRTIKKEQQRYLSAKTGESVFTIFLAVDQSPDKFAKISRGHFIYTPETKGLGDLHREQLCRLKTDFAKITKHELFTWLKDFCSCNSYEISIPVLKNSSLAPENKTGLIISLLFDGELFTLVYQAGWQDEFVEKLMEFMLETLENSIYPGLKDKVLFKKTATPSTMMKRFNNTNGSITGWSLEEKSPVPDSLAGIMAAVTTPIPLVYKAGQWSFSPSGVPISILTGRIAAGKILKSRRIK